MVYSYIFNYFSLRLTRFLGIFVRDRSGVAAVEFAILAIPFLFIVFAILETALVFMAEVTMDNAVDKMARTVRVGRAVDLHEAAFRQDFCSLVSLMFECSKVHIDLRSYASYASVPLAPPLSNGNLDVSDFQFQVAAAETIIDLRVYYEWPMHVDFVRIFLSNMANGSHLIIGNALFKTEPF